MSLIHDAIRKMEAGRDKIPGSQPLPVFQNPIEPLKPGPRRRTVILAIVLVLALVFFVYNKFFSGKTFTEGKKGGADAVKVQEEKNLANLKLMAIQSFEANDFESAWAHITTAGNLAGDDPEVWNNMGLIAKRRGDLNAALGSYQKALELKPNYPEAMNNMAVLKMNAGDAVSAKDLLGKALSASPSYPEAVFNMALVCEMQGDKAKAVDHYKRFLEIGGNFPNHLVNDVRDHVMQIEAKTQVDK